MAGKTVYPSSPVAPMKLLSEVGGELEVMGLEETGAPMDVDAGTPEPVGAKGPRAKRRRIEEDEAEDEDEDEDDNQDKDGAGQVNDDVKFMENEEEETFSLGAGIKTRLTAAELGFDDEDDFLIEDDLVASGSDLEPIESGESSEDDEGSEADENDDDDEFTKGLLNEEETNNPIFTQKLVGPNQAADAGNDANGLPYTFPCPQSLDELIEVTKAVSLEKVPIIVQRIRALYHPKLDSSNKSKLGNFAQSLVHYIAHLSNLPEVPSFAVLENLIRHIHSLAKSYPIEISNSFRSEVEEFGQSRRMSPKLGDLIILTAIGTIFPTS